MGALHSAHWLWWFAQLKNRNKLHKDPNNPRPISHPQTGISHRYLFVSRDLLNSKKKRCLHPQPLGDNKLFTSIKTHRTNTPANLERSRKISTQCIQKRQSSHNDEKFCRSMIPCEACFQSVWRVTVPRLFHYRAMSYCNKSPHWQPPTHTRRPRITDSILGRAQPCTRVEEKYPCQGWVGKGSGS